MSRVLLNLSKDIKELCDPYFKRFGLDHFNYIHRDCNGYVTYLCSNPTWLNHYLKQSYPKIGAFEQNTDLSKYNYILWNGLDRNDPILIDSKEMLGVEFGITLIKHEQDGVGFYNLGTKSSDSSIINKYVNNLDKYENFILGFQEKANTILLAAKKLKLLINPETSIDNRKKPGYQLGSLYFTEREFQCVNYLEEPEHFFENKRHRCRTYQLYVMLEKIFGYLLPIMSPSQKMKFDGLFKRIDNSIQMFYISAELFTYATDDEINILNSLINPRVTLIQQAIKKDSPSNELIKLQCDAYHVYGKLELMINKKIYENAVDKIKMTYLNFT